MRTLCEATKADNCTANSLEIGERSTQLVDLGASNCILSALHLHYFSYFSDAKLNASNYVNPFVATDLRNADILIVHRIKQFFNEVLKLSRL